MAVPSRALDLHSLTSSPCHQAPRMSLAQGGEVVMGRGGRGCCRGTKCRGSCCTGKFHCQGPVTILQHVAGIEWLQCAGELLLPALQPDISEVQAKHTSHLLCLDVGDQCHRLKRMGGEIPLPFVSTHLPVKASPKSRGDVFSPNLDKQDSPTPPAAIWCGGSFLSSRDPLQSRF